MKSVLIAYATALLVSTTAIVHAADMVNGASAAPVPVETVPASTFSWTGIYGGVQGGYDWADIEVRRGAFGGAQSLEGGNLGGFVGYNWQFGNNLVLGAEADLAHSWNKENLVPSIAIGSVNIETSGSLRGRVGYAFDRILIYGTGGVAKARGEFAIPGLGDETRTYTGWTAGAGVDFAATDHIFVRAEYRHVDYRKEFSILNTAANADFKQDKVEFGVGYKF